MQNWKFFLGIAIVLAVVVFLVSLLPGADTMLAKIWNIVWVIIQVALGVVLSVWLFVGPWLYGFVWNRHGLPGIDKSVERELKFEWYHFLVAGIVMAVIIALVQELSVMYVTFIPPMSMVIGWVHSNYSGNPGIWETLPIFWPIYALIIGTIGQLMGYSDYKSTRRW